MFYVCKDKIQQFKIPLKYDFNAPHEDFSSGALKDFPEYLTEAEKFKTQSYIAEIQCKERKASDEWYAELNRKNRGLNSQPSWKNPDYDVSSWPTMQVPGYWSDHGLGEVNGVVWFFFVLSCNKNRSVLLNKIFINLAQYKI